MDNAWARMAVEKLSRTDDFLFPGLDVCGNGAEGNIEMIKIMNVFQRGQSGPSGSGSDFVLAGAHGNLQPPVLESQFELAQEVGIVFFPAERQS